MRFDFDESADGIDYNGDGTIGEPDDGNVVAIEYPAIVGGSYGQPIRQAAVEAFDYNTSGQMTFHYSGPRFSDHVLR